MARDITGSIVKVVLNGVTYKAAADANLSETPPVFKNEAVASSGNNFRKMTKQPQQVESVTLLVNGDERESLRTLAEGLTDITMSYTTAAGDVYRAVGWIDFAKRTTEDGKAEISMFPRDTWTAFVNP